MLYLAGFIFDYWTQVQEWSLDKPIDLYDKHDFAETLFKLLADENLSEV